MECLIGLVIFAIVALILVLILEAVVGMFLPLPPQVVKLIRLLVGLIVLLRALECVGVWPGFGRAYPWR